MEKNINKEYRNSLIEKYMFLIENYVSKYDINEQDDIRGLGYCKLVEILDKYVKDGKQDNLDSYITNKLNSYFRSLDKMKFAVKYDTSVNYDSCSSIDDIDDKVKLDSLISSFDECNKNVMKLYLLSYSFEEIAKILNLSVYKVKKIYEDCMFNIKYNDILNDDNSLSLGDISIEEIKSSDLSYKEKQIILLLKFGLGLRTISHDYKISIKEISSIKNDFLIKINKKSLSRF